MNIQYIAFLRTRHPSRVGEAPLHFKKAQAQFEQPEHEEKRIRRGKKKGRYKKKLELAGTRVKKKGKKKMGNRKNFTKQWEKELAEATTE